MSTKFFYIKVTSLFFVVLGFSYCMTSFYNFYNYLFGNININGSNIVIMAIGLVIPLYMFIFGVNFYFYDSKLKKYTKKDSLFPMISFIILLLIGFMILIIKNSFIYQHFYSLAQMGEFLHISLGYVLIVLNIVALYGYIKNIYRKEIHYERTRN